MVHSQRGNKQALYIYEPNSFVPLATVQDQHTYWYQNDQIGAPQELTNDQGQVVWAADYKVWGEASVRTTQRTGTDDAPARTAWQTNHAAASSPPTVEQPFRFQGQQFDEESGLHYNRFRYYDPVVGRFASQDPIGLLGGSNAFAYAPNPVSWKDPVGLAKSKNCDCKPTPCTALQTYYPPNNGAIGPTKTETLAKGKVVDRYGYDGGSYVSPVGTPYGARALPPGSMDKPYAVFDVLKPIEGVETSKIAPWFGELGGGTQHKLPASVQDLCDSGHLKKR
jgi:RHS repeat-associated protein